MESVPPHGCSWSRWLDLLVEAHGSWAALVDALIRRAGSQVDLPEDPGSIEKGIRRLRTRGNAPGGQYGRWLLRFFRAPESLAATARWMGQYHSRFSDLPLSLRRSQLLLWDRPPVIESSLAAWIHLGIASVELAAGNGEAADERRRLAANRASDPEVHLEAALLDARLARDRNDPEGSTQALERAARLLEEVDADDYRARLLDQQAYGVIRDAQDLSRARDLYAAIPETTAFSAFRRAHGLAYCDWKLARSGAAEQARLAARHAGDAGLLSFRAMALELLAHILGEGAEAEEAEAEEARARAVAIRALRTATPEEQEQPES
ncbi:MAG: hypothetical protein AAGE52_33590 [Myxococcota bacterium]